LQWFQHIVMISTQPTRKDMAEFFRLSLLAGLCEPSSVASWADSVVASEESPHIAFIELCIGCSQPISTVQTLLGDIPGRPTPDLPVHMLLGHASRLAASLSFSAEELLLRLYRISSLEAFPQSLHFDISGFEDELSLARDGIYSTPSEVARDFVAFLLDYEPYAPATAVSK
jgi:hypothetical protein